MTHTGPAGRASLIDRYNLYNDKAPSNKWQENIANAQEKWYNTPELLCLQWIIDDGVASRGHRKNLFTPNVLQVGIGIYPIKRNTSQKIDRVTMFFAMNAPCSKCASFPKKINDQMCWSNFIAGQDSCDPDLIGSAGHNASHMTITSSPTNSGNPVTGPAIQPAKPPGPAPVSSVSGSANKPVPVSSAYGSANKPAPVSSSSGSANKPAPANSGSFTQPNTNKPLEFNSNTNVVVKKCPYDCFNRGKCVNGKCECNTGFTDYDCSKVVRPGVVVTGKACPYNCSNRGKCVEGKCQCNPGFTDYDCSKIDRSKVVVTKTCLNNCWSRGTCFDGKCQCQKGYSGEDCSKMITSAPNGSLISCPKNCSGRGSCVYGTCRCDSRYTGSACEWVYSRPSSSRW